MARALSSGAHNVLCGIGLTIGTMAAYIKSTAIIKQPANSRRIVVDAQGNGDTTSVAAALTRAVALMPTTTNGVVIEVTAGTYVEAAAMTIPTGVWVVGAGNPYIQLAAGVTSGSVFTMNGFSALVGCTVAPAALNNVVNGVSLVDTSGIPLQSLVQQCTFTNCLAAAVALSGPSTLVIQDCTFLSLSPAFDVLTDVLTGVLVQPGATARVVGGGVRYDGTNRYVGVFVNAAGDCDVHGSQVIGAVTGLRVQGTGRLRVSDTTIRECSAGVLVEGAGQLTMTAVEVRDTAAGATNYDLDIQDAGATVSANFCVLDTGRVNNPNGVDYRASTMSYKAGDEGLHVKGELHVGTPENPKETALGGGDSYTVGMMVKTSTSTDDAAGPFADVTVAAASGTGSTFTMFAGTAIDNTLYIGGPRQFRGVKITFGGTVADPALDATAVALEYWDGSAWTAVPRMVTNSNAPYESYVQTLNVAGQSTSVQVRFGLRAAERAMWVAKAIGGDSLFWVRLRVASPLTTVPTIEQIKLHSNRLEVNADGFVERFGAASVVQSLAWDWGTNEASGQNPAARDFRLSDDLRLGRERNNFQGNGVAVRDAVGFNFRLPADMDTSQGFRLRIVFVPVNGITAPGPVEWSTWYAVTEDGYATIDTQNVSPTPPAGVVKNTNVVTGTIGAAAEETQQSAIVFLDTSDYNPRTASGSSQLFWVMIERDSRNAANPDDTLQGDVAVVNIIADYVSVFGGAHTATF